MSLKLRKINPRSTGIGNNPLTIRPASNKVVAQATGQGVGLRTQHRRTHNLNAHAKERSRWNKLPRKNAHQCLQATIERPHPAEATVWSEQGSTATISTKYRKTAPQKWIAQSNVTQCRNRPLARSARRYKGVIGESKEGIGGTRNPPCPPWPPEAPKIKGKRIDNHLRKPNARKNRKIDPRRIQECIERTLK